MVVRCWLVCLLVEQHVLAFRVNDVDDDSMWVDGADFSNGECYKSMYSGSLKLRGVFEVFTSLFRLTCRSGYQTAIL